MRKRILCLLLALAAAVSLCAIPASAKTIHSAKADNVFFYATNSSGRAVLLRVMTLDELKKLSHGQADGSDYSICTTDNYATTQYCEARGFTVSELINYVKSVSTVRGADKISFTGSDTLHLMATDSYGNYSRNWTYDELYGVKRYYFEGLYDGAKGWNNGWEIAGESASKSGMTLEQYNEKYKSSDPYYADKRAVFESGKQTEVIFATQSYSGRTTTQTLSASTEPGIASYIAANGGTVAGCLKDVLTDDYALRLSLPMTQADLMAAHRTAYDNFKWIYNMKLDMADAPEITSLGTVAEPTASFRRSADGKTLTITFSCATAGASVYYSYDGAPQIVDTGAITLDLTGRDLDADPVRVYATAVKEGYDDAGILTFQYPGMAPAFVTLYSVMAGNDLTFTASDGVGAADWAAWTSALNAVRIKSPSADGYLSVDPGKYRVDNSAKTVTFDKSLFTQTGSYSFIFHATKYADKRTSVAIKKAAPALITDGGYAFGAPITLAFDDPAYQSGMSVYVTPEGGTRAMISSGFLDRLQAGQVTIKADYFASSSGAISGPGSYTLELNNNSYSPASQTVTITVTGNMTGYSDVASTDWFAPAVAYVTHAGLFNGTSQTTFSPDEPMTRGTFVTVLSRLAGVQTGCKQSGFSDVQADSWYASGVDWAVRNKVVDGYADGTFRPDQSITREQIAAVLYRYEKCTGGEPSAGEASGSYPDESEISAWAREPLSWAVSGKLMDGYADGRLDPQGTATRAQAAQILYRYAKEREADT